MKNTIILILAAVALILGVSGFLAIRPPGNPPLEFLPALYHALGLFVLNPGPWGLPQGDPAWAVVALWIAHFLAPLTLASFLVDALLSLLSRRDRSFPDKEGHAVVCGLGRTALLAVDETLKRTSPDEIVVVELFPECPQLPGVVERGVNVVMGSMEEEAVLRRAGVRGARRILALSNDDILNINTVAKARQINPSRDFVAVALVTDSRLMENLPASLKKDVTFLNTYALAADVLVREKRLTRGAEDAYVIAGFGHFGQMVLKALLHDDATARGDTFFVLDRDAGEKVRTFVETFGYGDHDIRPVKGNLYDPGLWADLHETLQSEDHKHDPIVLVCTDNDVKNLSLALSIRRHYVKESAIYCRLFGEVSFEQEMIKGHKIESYRVADLLRKNLPPQVLGLRKHD